MCRFRRKSAGIFWKEGKPPGKKKPRDFSFSRHYVYKNTHLSYETFFPLGSAEFEGDDVFRAQPCPPVPAIFYGDYLSYPERIQFKHPSVKAMVEKVPFEAAVNRFIDVYGKRIDAPMP